VTFVIQNAYSAIAGYGTGEKKIKYNSILQKKTHPEQPFSACFYLPSIVTLMSEVVQV
jgi:hypothetical protein